MADITIRFGGQVIWVMWGFLSWISGFAGTTRNWGQFGYGGLKPLATWVMDYPIKSGNDPQFYVLDPPVKTADDFGGVAKSGNDLRVMNTIDGLGLVPPILG